MKEKRSWLINWLFCFVLLPLCSFVVACWEESKLPVKEIKTASVVDFTEPTTGMQFVYVKGGCFKMGDIFGELFKKNNAKPVHEVCLDDFYIGKYEVTVGQFRKFVQDINCRTATANQWRDGCDYLNWRSPGFKQKENHPAVKVSWNDAQEFVRWLSAKSGKEYRLPTEAEWEYAARSGGKGERYSGFSDENEIYKYGNFCDKSCGVAGKDKQQDDGYAYTAPVGSYKPNGLGLYDMTGNVSEWCQDWYGANYYRMSPKSNPQGPSSCEYRVMRGGSWYNDRWSVKTMSRGLGRQKYGDDNTGFRISFSAQKQIRSESPVTAEVLPWISDLLPLSKNLPPRKLARGTEIILISGYEPSNYDVEGETAKVTINRPGSKVLLFLDSYEEVNWRVVASHGTIISGIIVSGHKQSTVSTKVKTKGYLVKLPCAYELNSITFKEFMTKLHELFSRDKLDVFRGSYSIPYELTISSLDPYSKKITINESLPRAIWK